MIAPTPVPPTWTNARVRLEIVNPQGEFERSIELSRPFALVGRLASVTIPLVDRAVSSRHVYIHVDSRGVFAVDLATRTGTIFSTGAFGSGWLQVGDSIEVAKWMIRVASHESDDAPGLVSLDLLGEGSDDGLAQITLLPVGHRGASWSIRSALSFAGRGESCGIRLNQADVSRMHCALLRTESVVFLIDFPGRPTLVNGTPPRGVVSLQNDDLISIGRTRFLARISPAQLSTMPSHSRDLPRFSPVNSMTIPGFEGLPMVEGKPFPIDLIPPESRHAVVAWMLAALHLGQNEILRRQEQLQTSLDQLFEQRQIDTQALVDESSEETPQVNDLPRPALIHDLPAEKELPTPEIDPKRSMVTATWLLERVERVSTSDKIRFKSLWSRFWNLGRMSPETTEENASNH